MAFQMTREENLFFAKRNIVDNIYREAHLEGIGVTFPETKEIYEGRAVAGLSIDDTVAINNLKHGWQFIFETLDVDIDLAYIRQLHSIVGATIVYDAGQLRSNTVSIGGTSWKPDLYDLDTAQALIQQITKVTPSTENALRAFMELARAQLFWDGNKRTSQLIANKMLIANGLGTFSVPVEDKPEFEKRLIEWYETYNENTLLSFLENKCIDGYNSKTSI